MSTEVYLADVPENVVLITGLKDCTVMSSTMSEGGVCTVMDAVDIWPGLSL